MNPAVFSRIMLRKRLEDTFEFAARMLVVETQRRKQGQIDSVHELPLLPDQVMFQEHKL